MASARQLFIERGYPSTTVEAIADAAGVPLPTVYRLFGSKRGILAAVVDVAFGGDDEPIAFHERPAVRAALTQADPPQSLASFAHICRDLLDRSAPIQEVIRSAAGVDREAAEMLAVIAQQRLTGQSRIARALDERNALAEGIDEARAADIIYVLMSPEVHRVLTVERRWTGDCYEQWLATALCRLLLPIDRQRAARSNRTPRR